LWGLLPAGFCRHERHAQLTEADEVVHCHQLEMILFLRIPGQPTASSVGTHAARRIKLRIFSGKFSVTGAASSKNGVPVSGFAK
jgi:hypothetical protein